MVVKISWIGETFFLLFIWSFFVVSTMPMLISGKINYQIILMFLIMSLIGTYLLLEPWIFKKEIKQQNEVKKCMY